MATYQEAAKEAYASAPSDVVTLKTLEISHPLTGTLYLVANREPLTLTLEDLSTHVFTASSFEITLPAKSEEGLQDLNLRLDNSDLQVTDFLNIVKLSKEPVVVKYRPYLSSDLTTPQLNPPLTLFIKPVSIGLVDVTAQGSFLDIINRKFPNEYYIDSRFPAIAG